MFGHRSSHSDASNVSDDVPSFVQRLDLAALASLALKTRTNLDGQLDSEITCSVISPPVVGGYNIVFFLAFSDEVRWVCRIPILEWSPVFEKRLRTDIACLRFIARGTSIPVPIVYDYGTSNDNVLGRPYTFTSVL
jgi:hypothetical protein